MTKNRTVAHAKFTLRLFGRGVFFALLALALTVAITSFLTACSCKLVEYTVHGPTSNPTHDSEDTVIPPDTKYVFPPSPKTLPPSDNLPAVSIPSDKKDN